MPREVSIRLISDGMLRVLWKQDRTRSSVSLSLRIIVRCLYGADFLAGLNTVNTSGVVMNVVNSAIRTNIANDSSFNT